MTYSAVAWAYKDLVTSAKLAQMVENTRAHDHRADGSQGAPTPNALVTFGANIATVTSTFLNVPWTTEVVDTGGMWVAGSPTRLTIPEPGLWLVIASISYASNGTGRRISTVLKNGVEVDRIDVPAAAANPHRYIVPVSEPAAAGDYFEAQAWQSSGAALNISSGRFSAVLLAR